MATLPGFAGDGDAVDMPDDAGPYAGALEKILRRIPPRWGRWIDVEAGWYPLIIDTDTRLAAIDPDYVVHQVKEKFGALRYYCHPGSEDPDPGVCDAFDAITAQAEGSSHCLVRRGGQALRGRRGDLPAAAWQPQRCGRESHSHCSPAMVAHPAR